MLMNSPCPSQTAIDDLANNRLSREESEMIRQHLAGCDRCKTHLNSETRRSSHTTSHEIPVSNPFPFLEPAQSDDEIGRLGNYRIRGILGLGGMSYVFDGEDLQLGRRVALKVLRPDFNEPVIHERFLQEAKLLASLPHEHIVTVYQIAEAGGLPYMSMERLEGCSLQERLVKDHWLPLKEALQITREAAQGLQIAHEAGLVHRDIKPANIWLESRDGVFRRVKLIDFGIARNLKDNKGLTYGGLVLGTPMYMSPEQAGGFPVDGRSDLYSLGGVLFEMLSGKPPFAGKDTDTRMLLRSIVNGEMNQLDELGPHVPPPVASMIQKLLSPDPRQRYQSAPDFIQQLKDLENRPFWDMSSQAFDAGKPSPLTRRRPPGLLGIILGILMILAASLVTAYAIYYRFSYSEPPNNEIQREIDSQ